ncbi:MAG TPA: PDZ domain-containing protein, partial [Tenuifilaceae bacterium]|nr:PDZ domain-containing protein [Tenuifilaceae bacterium]
LVGINAAIASGNGFYAGYSFAIPVNIVKKIVGDLIDYREVQRAFLGVSIREIDSKFAEDQGIKELRGVYVSDVNEGSAAKDAGIMKGDVIISVNKIIVNSTSELLEQISRYRPGEKVVVGVSRDGSEKSFNVTLRNRDGNTSLVKSEAKELAEQQNKSFVIVDGSPGIGCPVVSSLSGANYVVLVTEPTVSGLHDLERIYSVIKRFRINAGCIINKFDINPKKTDEIIEFLRKENITHLSNIPFDIRFTKAMTEAKTIVELETLPKYLIKDAWFKIKDELTNN